MNRFETEYQRLNPAQRQAVDYIDGPLLVVAGPGTGKTQLLSLRGANILRQTDVQPYNILCLTYTESGKQAMIKRLTDFLGQAAKQVEVHTFHGFGTRLITRFPDFFPELANFRPAEDLTLFEAMRACLVKLPRKNPLSKQAYGQFTYQADARDRISQLKRAGISPSEALKTAEADFDWCKATGRKLTNVFQQAGRLAPKVVDRLVSELKSILEQVPDSQLGKVCIDQLNEALTDSRQTGKTAAVSDFKRRWFTSESGQLFFKPTDQIKKLLALTKLYESYETELKKRKIYDYDDMILFALEMLKHNKEFLSLVQENFQYVLADEYQDTNAAQASIINLIAANPINEGRPNVMVVGDDDQAIYGFQGALGDVLMDFRERWLDVRVVILKNNYRSTESILNIARSIITQGQQRLENNYDDIDKSLLPQSDYANVAPVTFEASSPDAVMGMAVQSAKSAVPERQLAIIATKHKYLLELATKLDASKINYFYEGHEDLLKDPEVTTLLKLADAILAIRQKRFDHTNFVFPEIFALGILKIPRQLAWKISLDAKAQNSNWWQAMLSITNPEVKTATKILKELSKTIDANDAASSLKTITRAFGLRLIQKIQHLNSHATAYYGRKEISLGELLRYCELSQQAGVTLDFKIIRGKQEAPVVLLSAHKSKGLEFDRVYLLHADYRTWFKEAGRRNNLSLPGNWSAIEPLKADMDDRLRLLYVVMTRAKQELVLIKTKSGQIIPGLENIKKEQYISEQLEAFSLPEEKNWRHWFLPKTEQEMQELKKLLQPTLDSYHLSSTHLTIFLDLPHYGPTTFLTGILLGISEPVHPEAIFGSLVHRSLSFAQNKLNKTGKIPIVGEIEKFVKNEASNRDNIFTTDVVQVVYDYLQSSHVLKPGGVSEYSFSSQQINFNGMQLTGTVDHFISKENKLSITDFKTGRALNSWHVSEEYYKQKLHRFRQQLMFYELLFQLSPKFQLDSVTSQVDFVEPSRRDVYYRLNLDANLTERQKFEALITSVWQHIITLNLPDVDQYSSDFNGIIDFEDDLIGGNI